MTEPSVWKSRARALRSLARNLIDGLDGALHPRRHARAIRLLRSLQPSSVLFVCLGNICRSPFAARIFTARSARRIPSGSAGFIGQGRPPPAEAITAALSYAIDHSDHRSRILVSESLRGVDAVFVFDRLNAAQIRKASPGNRVPVFWLGDFDPEWSGKRAIPDPWGRGQQAFDRAFERIARCVDEVLRSLD